MSENVWEQVDAYARYQLGRRLRKLGWRLDPGSGGRWWRAFPWGAPSCGVSAPTPEAVYELAKEKEEAGDP